jgi:hypothetical protein
MEPKKLFDYAVFGGLVAAVVAAGRASASPGRP